MQGRATRITWDVMREIPSRKIQKSNTSQATIPKFQTRRLRFRIWNLFVICDFEIGISRIALRAMRVECRMRSLATTILGTLLPSSPTFVRNENHTILLLLESKVVRAASFNTKVGLGTEFGLSTPYCIYMTNATGNRGVCLYITQYFKTAISYNKKRN